MNEKRHSVVVKSELLRSLILKFCCLYDWMKRTVTCLKTRETVGIRNVAFVVLKFSDE
jgi:hypothetical protein